MNAHPIKNILSTFAIGLGGALKKLIALLSLAMFSTTAFAITDAQLFAYAEANFPGIFTGAATAGVFPPYNYRYYPASRNYLAVDTSGVVYILGPYTGGVVTAVGPMTAYAATITAWEATQVGTCTSPQVRTNGQCVTRPPTWGTAVNIASTATAYESINSSYIAFDTGGNSLAVWEQSGKIWANRYTVGSGWGTPARITSTSTTGGTEYNPRIAVDANGNGFAMWSYDNGTDKVVWADRYDAGSLLWGIARRLVPVNTALYALSTSSSNITFDASGNALVVWGQFDNTGQSVWIDGYTIGSGWWSTAVKLATNYAASPQIGYDAGGNVLAVWTDNSTIWARRYTTVSGWDTATRITPYTSYTQALAPSLTVDASGNGLVVWSEKDLTTKAVTLRTNRYTAGTGWGTATQIPMTLVGGIPVFDKSGNALSVWEQYDATYDTIAIWANRYTDGNGWGIAAKISADSPKYNYEFPSFAVDASGNALAVWWQHDGTGYVPWSNRYTSGTGWGAAAPIPTNIVGAGIGSLGVAVDTKDQAFVVMWGQKTGCGVFGGCNTPGLWTIRSK